MHENLTMQANNTQMTAIIHTKLQNNRPNLKDTLISLAVTCKIKFVYQTFKKETQVKSGSNLCNLKVVNDT